MHALLLMLMSSVFSVQHSSHKQGNTTCVLMHKPKKSGKPLRIRSQRRKESFYETMNPILYWSGEENPNQNRTY